jgi:hypothetical protein
MVNIFALFFPAGIRLLLHIPPRWGSIGFGYFFSIDMSRLSVNYKRSRFLSRIIVRILRMFTKTILDKKGDPYEQQQNITTD